MASIPSFSESDIRLRVGERSFTRGRSYFEENAIYDTRRQGRTLKAVCQGTLPDPYSLRVTFGDDDIASAECSCPVGDGGRCKHIAALLLTWLADPDAFITVEPVTTLLKDRSKEELIGLIERMVARHEDLEGMLALAAPAMAAEPLQAEAVHRQVRRAFAGDLYEWNAPRRVARSLRQIVDQGYVYAGQGDWASVLTLADTLVEETMGHYEMLHDEDGDIAEVINACVDLTGRCLENATDPTLRGDALRLLYEVYRWDIALGGIDMGYESEAFLTEATTPDERRTVAGWVRNDLEQAESRDTWGASWRQETLGELLLTLEGPELDDERYLQICRTSGRTVDLVDRLLALARLDEAVEAARSVSDYTLLTLTDVFAKHGHADRAAQLALDRLGEDSDERLVGWLKQHAAARGDAELVDRLARQLFWQRPSLERYLQACTASEALGRADAFRRSVRTRLSDEKTFGLLTQIYLADDEPAEALALIHLPRTEWGWHAAQRDQLAPMVADAIAATRPEEALHLYLDRIMALIEQRGRENYAEAARLLLRVKALYVRRGKLDDWQLLIDEIREANKRLRAFQDELEKAGL